MKTSHLTAFTFILLVVAATARGDAASKAPLLDEFVKANVATAETSLKSTVDDMVNRDPRIQPAEKSKQAQALLQSISRDELLKRIRTIGDQSFTEEEMKYITALLATEMFKKMMGMGKQILGEGRKYAKEQLVQNYEQVTRLKYQESFPTPEPGWFTKAIWEWIPSTRPACPTN
jgi:hypothetical protein